MANTRLQTVFKIGNLEVKRRTKLAEKPKAKSSIVTVSRGPVAGISGNAPMYGNMATGEYLSKLEGAKGRAIFDEMRRSDPEVISTLKAITLPIRQASYYMEPGSEETKNVEIAETIEKNLLEGMTITWDDTVRHALLMLPMGFSILEKIWEIRDDMLYLRKLDPRLPTSVTEWQYDKQKRRTTAVIQRDSNFEKYTLPIEKLLVFTNDKEGDNWEGTSVLRGAYKPWYIKTTLEKINAIKHERFGVGVPKGKVPKGITEGTPQWDAMESALEALYANEKSFLICPEGYDVDLLGGTKDTQGSDALPSIKYYDEAIAKAALAMFINLGTTETGSRALGGSFIEVFLLSLQSYADYICEVFNRFLIQEYVNSNWGEVENHPKLKVEQIKKLDPMVLAKLAEVGLITKDEAIENAMRNQLHLPEKEEEEEEEEKKKPVPPEKKEPEIEEEEIEQDEDIKPVAAHEHKQGYKLVDREMTAEELMVDVPSIELRLNEAQRNLEDQILIIKKEQADDIIIQLVGGRKIQHPTFRIILKQEMHNILINEFKRQIKEGKNEAEREVQSQLPKRGRFANPGEYDYQDYLEMFEDDLAIKIEGASNKLASTLATFALELKRKGLVGEDLRIKLQEKAQEKISDRTWSTLVAGAVNKGWGQGRDLAFKRYTDEEDYSYYSAILDGRACPNCLAKDGHHHKYGDPEYITPNPECDGGDSCRCMTIMVMKSESAAEEEYERRETA